MNSTQNFTLKATELLKTGKIIAYPTEAVFGLGCDPFNEKAVQRLRDLKSRSVDQGFILIAAHWQQISGLTQSIPAERLNAVQATWPGPHTWVFPASNKAPRWVCKNDQTIALRITDHPIAKALTEHFEGPIVSTSANIHGEAPIKSADQVHKIFGNNIDLVIDGPLGNQANATMIHEAISGKTLRAAGASDETN